MLIDYYSLPDVYRGPPKMLTCFSKFYRGGGQKVRNQASYLKYKTYFGSLVIGLSSSQVLCKSLPQLRALGATPQKDWPGPKVY